jgi:DNA polymerase (family 10)
MRQRALAKGYSLSEWGLKRRDEGGDRKPESGGDRKPEERGDLSEGELDQFGVTSEKELFAFLGLPEIPPELREGMGEFDLEEVPELVSKGKLRGVFHNHTTASDGRASIEEMAGAAADLGWDYLGLADHSKTSYQANGLDDARVLKQVEAIRAFNESGESAVHLFAGIECDILADGSLDLEDSTLDALDYAVMSVHSGFSQNEDEMTARVIRAVEHPATTMLGHPTGRLLLRREPYRIDLRKVIDACIDNRVIIEINANPRRLDLDWRLWRRAAERGLICAINPDAHSTEGLKYFEAGVNMARKGWLGPDHILNCRDAAGVQRWFDERK